MTELNNGSLNNGSIERVFTLVKVGYMLYSPKELGLEQDKRQEVKVHYPKELLSLDKVVKSFCYMPITMEHEKGFIDTSNSKEVIRGMVCEIWYNPSSQSIEGKAIITDKELISFINSGNKLEVSGGWQMLIEPYGSDYMAVSMVGNHVSIVQQGRCGRSCSINRSINNSLSNSLRKAKLNKRRNTVQNKECECNKIKVFHNVKNSDEEENVEEQTSATQEDSSTKEVKELLEKQLVLLEKLLSGQEQQMKILTEKVQKIESFNVKMSPYIQSVNATSRENQQKLESIEDTQRSHQQRRDDEIDEIYHRFCKAL